MKIQETLSRSLVSVRTWPVLTDMAVALCGLAVFFAMAKMGSYWLAKPTPAVVISHSIRALPLYAFYSIVRIGIAYLLSLFFAVGYGYIAAYNPRVEAWMIAVLDILQSIPVLSFLPRRDAGDDGADSRASTGHRDGLDPADLYGAGVEHGVQLLFVAEEHSAGDD